MHVVKSVDMALMDVKQQIKHLEDYKASSQTAIFRHDTNIAVCGRNIQRLSNAVETKAQGLASEIQKLQTDFITLQAAVKQQRLAGPGKPVGMENSPAPEAGHQAIEQQDSGHFNTTAEDVDEVAVAMLFNTLEQRLRSWFDQHAAESNKALTSSVVPKSTTEQLSKAQEKSLFEKLEKHLMGKFGQKLSTALKQHVMEGVEQELLRTLTPRFEALDVAVKENANASKEQIKLEISDLESRMLSALQDKNERVTDLQSAQVKLNQMIEKLEKRSELLVGQLEKSGERIEKLEEHNTTLGNRLEQLMERYEVSECKAEMMERKMKGLQETAGLRVMVPRKSPSNHVGEEVTTRSIEIFGDKWRCLGDIMDTPPESREAPGSAPPLQPSDVVEPSGTWTRPTAAPESRKRLFSQLEVEEMRKHKRTKANSIRDIPVVVRTSRSSSPTDLFPVLQQPEAEIPASIKTIIASTLFNGEDDDDGPALTLGRDSIGQCLRTASHVDTPDWPRGKAREAACRYCTRNGYPCLSVTANRALVLLPLAEELRKGMEPSEKGYWIAARGEKDVWNTTVWEDIDEI